MNDRTERVRPNTKGSASGCRRAAHTCLALLCVAVLLLALAPAAQAAKAVLSYFPTSTGSGEAGGLFNAPRGLAVNKARLVAVKPFGAGTAISSPAQFTTPALPPDLGPAKAFSVSDATATLAASVNPNNSPIGECRFEYGTDESYGKTVSCSPGNAAIDSPNEVQEISICASAGNFRLSFGADTTGDLPFNASASQVQAALEGLPGIGIGDVAVSGGPGDGQGSHPYVVTFIGDLAATDVEQIVLEQGTLSTGNGCPESVVTTTSGGFPVQVTAEVGGLAPSTAYHFRLVADNGVGGPQQGAAASFATRAPVVFPTRGYELVSALDVNGFPVLPDLSAPDGDHYAYTSGFSERGGEVGDRPPFRASRNPDGTWSQEYVGGPTPKVGTGVLFPQAVHSGDDLSWVAWGSEDRIDPDDQNRTVDGTGSDTYLRGPGGDITWISRDPRIPTGTPQTDPANAGRLTDGGPRYVAPDGSRVLFESERRLLPADLASGSNRSLYEWDRRPADARQSLTVSATAGSYTLTATTAAATGTLTAGSPTVTGVSIKAGTFRPGDVVSGNGIPPATTVVAVGAGSLTLSTNATTSGVQTLTVKEATPPIAAGAGAGEVQSALAALASVGPGNVGVSGGPGDATGSAPYTIDFGGSLAGAYVGPLSAASIDLSGGSPSSSVATATLRPGGHLSLVGIQPGSSSGFVAGSVLGSLSSIDESVGNRAVTRNAVSPDGRRVVFQSGASEATQRLYVRIDGESTVEASASSTDPTPFDVNYVGADRQTESVFFTSSSPLTADSAAPDTAGGNADLYRYQVDAPAGERLVDLTPASIAPGGAGVTRVLDVSGDGRRVYFLAKAVLSPGASPAECTNNAATSCNLYLVQLDGPDDDTAKLSFIAHGYIPLGQQESTVALGNDFGSTAQKDRQVVANPDGSVLAFRSTSALVPGRRLGRWRQIYVYDADRGELSCASCPSDGSAPASWASLTPASEEGGLFAGFQELNAQVPHVRNVASDGTVFFQTASSLLPTDTNGKQNVYEYRGGRLHLITSGSAPFKAIFGDASENGSTVFFQTASGVVPGVPGGIERVYAARIGGGAPEPPPPAPPCTGEDCKPVATPQPNYAAPSTSTIQGRGNVIEKPVRTCPKGSRKVRHGKPRCIRTRRRHHRGGHARGGTK
jgi:hypothetical protein